MKIKTKKLNANVARRIMASLVAGSLVFCTGSFAFAADDIKPTNPSSDNNVVVNETNQTINGRSSDHDGKFSEVDGGAVDRGNSGSASNNEVTINGNKNAFNYKGGSDNSKIKVENFLNGGVNRGYGDANNNFVLINGGTFDRWVEGGWATYGNAIGNILTIKSGTFNKAIIDGGYTAYGNANNNTINIEDGYFDLTGGPIHRSTGEIEYPGIYGGYVAESGNAEGNVINITTGKSKGCIDINGDIVGGYTASGEVRNNTINIYGGGLGLAGANLYAAKVGDKYTSQQGWGNSLNFHTKNVQVKGIDGFDTIKFYLPSNIQNGDWILHSTNANFSDTRILMTTNGTNLHNGDVIKLIQNDTGLGSLDINKVKEFSPQQNGRNYASYGYAWDNYVDFQKNGNTLTATVQERVQSGLKDQIRSLAVSENVVKGMIDSGTDRLLNWLPPEELEMKGIKDTTTYEAFMGMGGEYMKIDGVKNKSGGTNIGFARALKNRHGMFIFAPITDYGAATYTSNLDDGTRGGGNAQYFTAGLIARQWNTNGMYYEASFRGGRMRTSFASDNFEENGEFRHISYRDNAPVYTGHVRIGWRGNVSPQNILDVYGVYSHNHVGDIKAELPLSQGSQTYSIDSKDSKRIRLGARLTRNINDHNRFYSGIAYQYNFDSTSLASFMGETSSKTGLKGSSGMIELGWQLKPTQNSAVMLDSALVGWVGKQKGLSFQIKLKKDF